MEDKHQKIISAYLYVAKCIKTNPKLALIFIKNNQNYFKINNQNLYNIENYITNFDLNTHNENKAKAKLEAEKAKLEEEKAKLELEKEKAEEKAKLEKEEAEKAKLEEEAEKTKLEDAKAKKKKKSKKETN